VWYNSRYDPYARTRSLCLLLLQQSALVWGKRAIGTESRALRPTHPWRSAPAVGFLFRLRYYLLQTYL